MPYLTKRELNQFIRTGCMRQLRLNLFPDNRRFQQERDTQAMPPVQPPRPGLPHIVEAGRLWEEAKLHELFTTFGADSIVGTSKVDRRGRNRFQPIPLECALDAAHPYNFLIEAEYTVGESFQTAMGIEALRETHGLEYGNLRPDIIYVLPPRAQQSTITPAGEIIATTDDDTRLQLRVIDIKLTAEPSPSYFAEVVYYSIVLAGWLEDNGMVDRFSVVPNAALWPGTHDASSVMKRFRALQADGTPESLEMLAAALEDDLEEVPFEVFALRIARFLKKDIPRALNGPWQELDWHVDNRCKGCDYLGFPWIDRNGNQTNHPDQCVPMAETRDHLSRVAFVSRGARASLQEQEVDTVTKLAQLESNDERFDSHQALRATRTVVSGRAQSLQGTEASIPNEAGSSASMPKWADLRIYLSVDFDVGSAISVCFGLKAFWLAPNAGANGQRAHRIWDRTVFVVDRKSLDDEKREVLALLDAINNILNEARQLDRSTSFQIYMWDNLQYDHMRRVFGRHLQAILSDSTIQRLAWLFPPEEVLPNPASATRKSPLTIVRDIIKSLVAAPIPHYYSLLSIAREYHRDTLPTNVATFSVHPLFEDPLSDQIPSERAHEIWSHSTTPHWTDQLDRLRETVKKRLNALEAVTERIQDDLSHLLTSSSPLIGSLGPPPRANRISRDGQLWFAHAKLDAAITELDVYRIRAMPPHEREARFECARLERMLQDQELTEALQILGLTPNPRLLVYTIAPASREVKLREGDFNWAIAQESFHGFLENKLPNVVRGTPLETDYSDQWNVSMEALFAVTVKGLSRELGFIALELNDYYQAIRDDLINHGFIDLSENMVLEHTYHDFFSKRLEETLRAIGNPPIANDSMLVRSATGQLTGKGAHRTVRKPVADAIWDATVMHQADVTRNLQSARTALEAHQYELNDSQWAAWEAALSHRLQLIWGPPGTGKSRTLIGVVLGALIAAQAEGHPLRVLVCASTYNALDNILSKIIGEGEELCPAAIQNAVRLRSEHSTPNQSIDPQYDAPVNQRNPSEMIQNLRNALLCGDTTTLVGATPVQIHKLIALQGQDAVQEMFDLIVIDEASQMDVAHALLALSGMAPEATLILAADPLQLQPILKAEPPKQLETMVGSIYNFYRAFHNIDQQPLEVNYRSNQQLINFAHIVGYRRELTSWSPDLQIGFASPLPEVQPEDWPTRLEWSVEWAHLLDPESPCCCVVYEDGRSSQSNEFEANALATLVYLLYGRLQTTPLNERIAPGGDVIPPDERPMAPAMFWKQGVGIVTPHRAQQGMIISKLQNLFVNTESNPSDIRDAVDTVERFQGQQRDIILASYSLGDPDQIASEDEFLLSLNRFNVMASRARAKLIVFVSQEIIDHLSDDIEVLRESRLLKVYAERFCSQGRAASLSVRNRYGIKTVNVTVRMPGPDGA